MRGARCASRKARRQAGVARCRTIVSATRCQASSRYESASSTSLSRDALAPVEVRDRARHPQHPIVAAAAERDPVADREQARGQAAVERHLPAREPPVHVAVAHRAGAGEPRPLAAARAAITRSRTVSAERCGLLAAHQIERSAPAPPGRPGRSGRRAARSAGAIARQLDERAGAAVRRPARTGQRLQAATTIALAGKSSVRCPRVIATRPSSSGWRSASSAARRTRAARRGTGRRGARA